MARYTGSVCKVCRREGLKLFFKGDRCYTDKCSFDRRSYGPGQHGHSKGKVSEYALQLREKQKVKRTYGLMETQFSNTFKKAEREKGITGERLLSLLEKRLDNVAYRLGFASSRSQARMLVTQGHLQVNGKRVNIPSYSVSLNDVITVADKSRKVGYFTQSLETVDRRGVPEWLSLDKDQFKGVVMRLPERDDITMPITEQLIVELYSK
ncbi:MAG: 30S ribosomal protein S4 [Thermodesulfobacteriota bacterium]